MMQGSQFFFSKLREACSKNFHRTKDDEKHGGKERELCSFRIMPVIPQKKMELCNCTFIDYCPSHENGGGAVSMIFLWIHLGSQLDLGRNSFGYHKRVRLSCHKHKSGFIFVHFSGYLRRAKVRFFELKPPYIFRKPDTFSVPPNSNCETIQISRYRNRFRFPLDVG